MLFLFFSFCTLRYYSTRLQRQLLPTYGPMLSSTQYRKRSRRDGEGFPEEQIRWPGERTLSWNLDIPRFYTCSARLRCIEGMRDAEFPWLVPSYSTSSKQQAQGVFAKTAFRSLPLRNTTRIIQMPTFISFINAFRRSSKVSFTSTSTRQTSLPPILQNTAWEPHPNY